MANTTANADAAATGSAQTKRLAGRAWIAVELHRGPDDPAVEYDKAVQVFTETHDLFLPSYIKLMPFLAVLRVQFRFILYLLMQKVG